MHRIALYIVLGVACAPQGWRTELVSPEDVGETRPRTYLECHMADGALYVFESWSACSGTIRGTGVRYDPTRQLRVEGSHEVRMADVERFRTTRRQSAPATRAAAVVVPVLFAAGLVILAHANTRDSW